MRLTLKHGVLIACLIIVFLFFYILNPLCFFWGFDASYDHRFYFSIVSVFATTILSLMAVVLGWFYYFDKERRSQLKFIISKLDRYDFIVTKILYLDVKNQTELDILRAEKSKLVHLIQTMMENVKLPDADMEGFIKLNSFVDKDDFISSDSLNNLNKIKKDKKSRSELSTRIERYGDKFVEAQNSIVKNIK